MDRERPGGVLAGQLGMLYGVGAVGDLGDGPLLARFLGRDDPAGSEAAFAALLERHGPMVLGTCRRILGDPHDAADAFQATFLLLVRKAATIRRRESVGDWLFRIARRVAVRAAADTARRRRRIEELAARRLSAAAGEVVEHDADRCDGALIAEVDRLPEPYRAVVVLHYFEGLSAEAAAQRLGCARGTVLSRLARARERLRARLERRGVSLEAAWPVGVAVDRLAWRGTVPATLAGDTTRAAVALALGGAAIEGVVPATVAGLARGVGRTLVLARVRTATCLFILAAAGVSIGLAASHAPVDEPARPAATGQSARPQGKTREDSLVFRGQVLNPDGKPVAGASIVVSRPDGLRPPRRLATSGADGRFEAAVPRAEIEEAERNDLVTHLAALAAGFGPAWVKIDRRAAEGSIAIRLVRGDVPIEGRVLDLEGRGVSDAKVSVDVIADLSNEFLAALRTDGGRADPGRLWNGLIPPGLVLAREVPIAVRTGPDGRFRLGGLGRNRCVTLIVEGESIVKTFVTVLTADIPGSGPLRLAGDRRAEFTMYGSKFELVVPPGRAVEGVVRDRDTGRPIPGAKVGFLWALGDTNSDGQGRFRLTGMPKGKGEENLLDAASDDRPYVKISRPVGDPQGLGPVQADIELKRGVWVEGRVINKTNGRPVRAIVQYLALRDNPRVKEYPGASIFNGIGEAGGGQSPTDADGRFRVVALPGAGLLVVEAEPGYLIAKPLAPEAAANVLDPANFEFDQVFFQALVPIDVRPNEVAVIPDIALIPGRPQHMRPIGPDGRPVERTIHFGGDDPISPGDVLLGAEFTFIHTRPGQPETVVILSEDRKLGASVDIKGDELDPIRVAMRLTGTVTGRLVDEDGRPRPNVRLELRCERQSDGDTYYDEQPVSPPLSTGPDGRFRIAGLVPGLPYTVTVVRKGARRGESPDEGKLHSSDTWTVKPGEVRDWGDVRPDGTEE